MLYLTGDTHGDFRRFREGEFPELDKLTKADYVIICGDFGGVWNKSREQEYWLNWLEKEKPYTTLFIDGNHENHADLLRFAPRGMFDVVKASLAGSVIGNILLVLGMIGEYIGRIYMCINRSPQYVVRRVDDDLVLDGGTVRHLQLLPYSRYRYRPWQLSLAHESAHDHQSHREVRNIPKHQSLRRMMRSGRCFLLQS